MWTLSIDHPVDLHRNKWDTGPVGDHNLQNQFLEVKEYFLRNLNLL